MYACLNISYAVLVKGSLCVKLSRNENCTLPDQQKQLCKELVICVLLMNDIQVWVVTFNNIADLMRSSRRDGTDLPAIFLSVISRHSRIPGQS